MIGVDVRADAGHAAACSQLYTTQDYFFDHGLIFLHLISHLLILRTNYDNWLHQRPTNSDGVLGAMYSRRGVVQYLAPTRQKLEIYKVLTTLCFLTL